MVHNDKNKDTNINSLDDINYKSISTKQGQLLLQQKENIVSKNDDLETIEINSSENTLEGFLSSMKEGFHEEPPSKIQAFIEKMTKWMINEFKLLDKLLEQYKNEKIEYDKVEEQLTSTTKNYLSRTNKDNQLSGKNVRFRDGEQAYVTNKGVIRDYDGETYLKTHHKNNCNSNNTETGITRSDFINQGGSVIGERMKLKKTDILKVRIVGNNQYIHISEIEVYDSQGENHILPNNKQGKVNIYVIMSIAENDYRNNSDNYKIYLTRNGVDVSEGLNLRSSSFPLVRNELPRNVWYNIFKDEQRKGLFNRHYARGVRKLGIESTKGIRIRYYYHPNCHKWSPRNYYGSTIHGGPLYFRWRNGNIVGGAHDRVGIVYEGYIKAPVTGRFNFHGFSDDGQEFRILIPGQGWKGWFGIHLNHGWSDAGRYRYSVNLQKDKYYRWYILHRECGGWANIGLYWSYPGKGEHLIPASAFWLGSIEGKGPGRPRPGRFNLKFNQVTQPFNGFRIDPLNKKLEIKERIRVWIKRADLGNWRQGVYYDSSNDRYNVIKVTDKVKISLPPFNPFIYQAYMIPNNNVGWTGYVHYPLDGNSSGRWPNSVHSATWRGKQGYEIYFDSSKEIDKVVVRNRPDCCQGRLNGAKLQLISPDNSVVREYRLDGSLTQTFYTLGGPQGTSCGNEGGNVIVSKIGEIGDADYIGCYKDNWNRRMTWEGKWGTYDECKQFAIDNNAPYFGLQASNWRRDIHACMYSKDLNKTISYGERKGRCPTRPYSKRFGPVGSGWTNAVYALDKTNYEKMPEKQKNITTTITTKTGINLAACKDLCEQDAGCNAVQYDESYRLKVGLQPVNLGRNTRNAALRARRGGVVDKFLSLATYEIVTRVYLDGNHRNWRNIFHYGNSNVERAPALWLFPHMAHYWRLHFRIRSSRSWNDGWDFNIPSKFRKFKTRFTVRIRVSDTNTDNPYIQAWINGVYVGMGRLNGRRISRLTNRNFWIKDPWYSKDGYDVDYLVLKDPYSRWENGKCEIKKGQEITQSNDNNTRVFNKLTKRPFEQGLKNLGKIGYVDEKGVLHEYKDNMVKFKNNWSVKHDTYAGHAQDVVFLVTKSIQEAQSYANGRNDIAGFIRIPDGKTWFKNLNMWPVNPRSPHQFARGVQLWYKEKTFEPPQTCEKGVTEITSLHWENYDKGNDMSSDFKCGLATYSDDLAEKKLRLSRKLSRLGDEIRKKITNINEANVKLQPYMIKENSKISSIMSQVGEIKNKIGNIGQLENANDYSNFEPSDNSQNNNFMIPTEGMTNLEEAQNKIIHTNQEPSSALIGLIGLSGLILGASYLTKK
jgi:hypothetical protein